MAPTCKITAGRRPVAWLVAYSAALALASCGGGGSTGNSRDSGQSKTYLSVEASDADGDALQYQWRVTGGSIDNRNASQTVWTMPASRGIHFAYVTISDGRGGYVEQQYAVNGDNLDLLPPERTPIVRAAPAVTDVDGATVGLRFFSADDTRFQPAAAGVPEARIVLLPDVQVDLLECFTPNGLKCDPSTGRLVFSGTTDLSGELDLPKLVAGKTYTVRCTAQDGVPLQSCDTFDAGNQELTCHCNTKTLPSRMKPLNAFKPANSQRVVLTTHTPCGRDQVLPHTAETSWAL